MRNTLLAAVAACCLAPAAWGQSNPGFVYGQTPTPAQWNGYFGGKVDTTGGTMSNATVNGTFTANGSLTVGGNSTIGGTLGVTGNTTVGTLLTPTITSPAGANLNIGAASSSQLIVFKNGISGPLMLEIGGGNGWVETEATLHLQPPTTPGNYGFNMNNTWTGSSSSQTWLNLLQAVDNTSNSSQGGSAVLGVNMTIGASSATGPKNAFSAQMGLTHASGNTTGVGGSYSAGQFTAVTGVNDNGTGLTTGTARGTIFGLNSVATLNSGATNYTGAVSYEADVNVATGASVMDKIGIQVVQVSGDAVQGARDDVAFSINNQSGTAGWTYGLEFGRAGGSFPIASSGTMIYGQGNLGSAFSVANGIDWSKGTATGYWLKLGSVASIDGSGNVSAASYKVGSTAGVSCAAGTVSLSTLVVTNGIVTHC